MTSERKIHHADRYLPCRKGTSNESFNILKTDKATSSTCSTSTYATFIQESMKRCLSFKSKPNEPPNYSSFATTFKDVQSKMSKSKSCRKIEFLSSQKILCAPNVVDNFYLSLFDGSKSGILGIALDSIYLVWPQEKILDFDGHKFHQLISMSCLKFSKCSNLLNVGYNSGQIDVIDLQAFKIVRSFRGHEKRIGCIEPNQQWGFLSGSRDNSIVQHDLRLKNPKVITILLHQTEVCGIAAKDQIVASGGASGKVNIWDLRTGRVIKSHKMHQSAAKALKWCPWKCDLLASGGGTQDHKIILWDIKKQTNSAEKILEGKSQVTGLQWRKQYNDLVSIHSGRRQTQSMGGYGLIWNLQSGKYEKVLKGHESRILGLCVNEKENEIWTIGADETLRMWNSAPKKQAKKQKKVEKVMSEITDFNLK